MDRSKRDNYPNFTDKLEELVEFLCKNEIKWYSVQDILKMHNIDLHQARELAEQLVYYSLAEFRESTTMGIKIKVTGDGQMRFKSIENCDQTSRLIDDRF